MRPRGAGSGGHPRSTPGLRPARLPPLCIWDSQRGLTLPREPDPAPPTAPVLPRILRFPWQLLREQVRQTVAEALQVWSDVTPLTFTEVHEGHADIVIDFTR